MSVLDGGAKVERKGSRAVGGLSCSHAIFISPVLFQFPAAPGREDVVCSVALNSSTAQRRGLV